MPSSNRHASCANCHRVNRLYQFRARRERVQSGVQRHQGQSRDVRQFLRTLHNYTKRMAIAMQLESYLQMQGIRRGSRQMQYITRCIHRTYNIRGLRLGWIQDVPEGEFAHRLVVLLSFLSCNILWIVGVYKLLTDLPHVSLLWGVCLTGPTTSPKVQSTFRSSDRKILLLQQTRFQLSLPADPRERRTGL